MNNTDWGEECDEICPVSWVLTKGQGLFGVVLRFTTQEAGAGAGGGGGRV